MNKRKKKVLIFILSLFLFLSLMTLFINVYMVSSTKDQIIDINNISEINDIDAIIILGCRIDGDSPSLMLARRLDKGIDVYNELHTKIIVSGNGTKDEDEVSVMKEYLLSSDINPNDIYLDYEGYTTYDSIYRVKEVFNAKKIVIITQEYHMYRSLYLANKLDIEAIGVVADDIPQKYIMLKNRIREVLSRDKNFFKGIIRPDSKYTGKIQQYVLED